MQFFFYCSDRAGAGETRRALLKEHWAFMRQYVPAMIARGPTMSADGKAVTGSMHIVDLPDAAAAGVFAHEDPLAKGGVFADITVRRFRNMTGRTMWQFDGDAKNPRFLFIGEAAPGAGDDQVVDAQQRYFGDAVRARNVIVSGPLLGADGRSWGGCAVLLEAADAGVAGAIIAGDPAARLYARAELRQWRFGGEENLQDLIARR
jgi:uncharacterized protein